MAVLSIHARCHVRSVHFSTVQCWQRDQHCPVDMRTDLTCEPAKHSPWETLHPCSTHVLARQSVCSAYQTCMLAHDRTAVATLEIAVGHSWMESNPNPLSAIIIAGALWWTTCPILLRPHRRRRRRRRLHHRPRLHRPHHHRHRRHRHRHRPHRLRLRPHLPIRRSGQPIHLRRHYHPSPSTA
jgi:hypothetical protein